MRHEKRRDETRREEKRRDEKLSEAKLRILYCPVKGNRLQGNT